MLREHDREGGEHTVDRDRADECATAHFRFQIALCFQGAEGLPDRGPADLQLFGELPFRGQLVAGLQRAALDQAKDLFADLFI